jgi:hypothetical protein
MSVSELEPLQEFHVSSRQDMRGYTPGLATGQTVRDTHVKPEA